MPIGLHANIIIDPKAVRDSRWTHDMANALCRAKLALERKALTAGRAASQGTSRPPSWNH